MDFNIIKKGAFKIAGMKINTTTTNNKHAKRIPELWNEFIPKIKTIQGIISRDAYGISIDTNHPKFSYMACVEVSDSAKIPKGMLYLEIPASKYAVFKHKGKANTVGFTYDAIFGEHLPKANLEVNTDAYCFELYDEHFEDKENAEMDIYVPIK